jgi:hypothetical protein
MKITRTITTLTLVLTALFFLMMAPKDLVVKVDGVTQEIESDIFATYALGNSTIDYYTSSVRLSFKKRVSVEI